MLQAPPGTAGELAFTTSLTFSLSRICFAMLWWGSPGAEPNMLMS